MVERTSRLQKTFRCFGNLCNSASRSKGVLRFGEFKTRPGASAPFLQRRPVRRRRQVGRLAGFYAQRILASGIESST